MRTLAKSAIPAKWYTTKPLDRLAVRLDVLYPSAHWRVDNADALVKGCEACGAAPTTAAVYPMVAGSIPSLTWYCDAHAVLGADIAIAVHALREAAEDVEWCSAAVLNPERSFSRQDIAASLRARAQRIEAGEPHPAPTERGRVVGRDDDEDADA